MSRPSMGRAALCAALLLGSTACNHVIITTGSQPGPEVRHEKFQMAFAIGIVPATIDASALCPGRRWSQVETQQSFLNWVVAGVTSSIITPMDIKVTCAAS